MLKDRYLKNVNKRKPHKLYFYSSLKFIEIPTRITLEFFFSFLKYTKTKKGPNSITDSIYI